MNSSRAFRSPRSTARSTSRIEKSSLGSSDESSCGANLTSKYLTPSENSSSANSKATRSHAAAVFITAVVYMKPARYSLRSAYCGRKTVFRSSASDVDGSETPACNSEESPQLSSLTYSQLHRVPPQPAR